MLVSYEEREGYKVCKVNEKRVDASNVVEFREGILVVAESVNILLLDMSNVEFIDSSVLSALVYIHKIFQQQNKTFVLLGLTKKVLSIFELTSISEFFKIYQSFDDFVKHTNTRRNI